MTNDQIDSAARQLASARLERRAIGRLPESCRPQTLDDVLAVQHGVTQLLGDEIGGWKCSLPKGERVLLAPLLRSTIRTGSPCPIVPSGDRAQVEPEIAFVLGKDLPPRREPYGEEEVRRAIAEVRLSLELIGSRYVDWTAVPYWEALADSYNNQGFFAGPPLLDPFEQGLGAFKISVDDSSANLLTREGNHPAGHPVRPVVWLANFLAGRGATLHAGSVVTTGSYAGILELPLDTALSISYGNLGKLEVTFVRV